EALEIAHRGVADGQPLISPLKNVWTLAKEARRIVGGQLSDRTMLHRQRVLRIMDPGAEEASEIVSQWFEIQDRIISVVYYKLTGRTPAGARGALYRRVQEGRIVRGEAAGRNCHYHQPGIDSGAKADS